MDTGVFKALGDKDDKTEIALDQQTAGTLVAVFQGGECALLLFLRQRRRQRDAPSYIKYLPGLDPRIDSSCSRRKNTCGLQSMEYLLSVVSD